MFGGQMFGGQNWVKNLHLAMKIKRDMGRCKTNNPLVRSSVLFLALFHYILCCLHRMDTHTHTPVPQLGTGTATVKFFFLPAWHFLCRFSDTLFECWVWKSRLKRCLPRPLIFGNVRLLLKTSSFLWSATSLKNKIVSMLTFTRFLTA